MSDRDAAALREAGELVSSFDIDDTEIADYTDDSTRKHKYFYRPFIDQEILGPSSPWKPQVCNFLL